MSLEYREWKKYICLRCKRTFDPADMELIPGVHCPYCGYKIIAKTRSFVTKRIKAV
ncbi:MAG: DNA-directed RNA polymerase subunit P [Thermoprotei archaeon]|nr:MAG: DNA-directed RNA polymerase subunit P [Thermoprotei archaeon]